MATFRHAAYRASLLATRGLRTPRVQVPRQLQFLQIARPSIAAFSTRSRLFSEGFDQLQSSVQGSVADNDESKLLYVGNLFFDVTHNQLQQHFDSYGEIISAKVITNPEGQSKGYGFIEFADIEAARAAREALNLSNFAGRRIIVHWARPMSVTRPPRERPTTASSTLFIGNLSYDMTDKELNELFRPLKNIRDVRVSVDRHTGRPRGFAHADFIDEASATAALKVLEGRVIRDRVLRCDYSGSNRRNAGSASASPQQGESVMNMQDSSEGSHEPPQSLENQPEADQEKEFEQPGDHPTQQLENETEGVPEGQAEKQP